MRREEGKMKEKVRREDKDGGREKERKEPSKEEVSSSSSKLPLLFLYFIQTGELLHNTTHSG